MRIIPKVHQMHDVQCAVSSAQLWRNNILAYWKAKSNNRFHLPSEQMFNVAKFTINPTRNHLDTEEVRATSYLKTWFAAGLIKEEFIKDNN